MNKDSRIRIEDGEWKWSLNVESYSFHFSCSLCGSCCRGDMTISLNLLDLQNMAKFLEFRSCAALFEQSYVREIPLTEGGFRPAIQFRTAPSIFCPFLENRLDDKLKLTGLCRLHPELKPLVCHLAPLGREIEFNENLHALESWVFTEPVFGCPGCRVDAPSCAKDYLENQAEALNLEKHYFKVMTQLQRSGAKYEVFREFHQRLTVSDDLSHYLEAWERKVSTLLP